MKTSPQKKSSEVIAYSFVCTLTSSIVLNVEGAHGYPTTASKKAAADAKLEAGELILLPVIKSKCLISCEEV